MYYYEHENGTIINKVDGVVDAAGGPDTYFDSPFVKRWWHEEERPLRIYVASSWKNEHQQAVVQALREDGHEVYDFKDEEGFHWQELDGEWEKWTSEQYIENLAHPRAHEGFKRDMDALDWCDMCVMVMPCGMSAGIELGYAQGKRKMTAVYVPDMSRGPDLMVKMADVITHDLDNLRYQIKCGAIYNNRVPSTNGSGIKLQPDAYQAKVHLWMMECFGLDIAMDKTERNHRFFEEATELVQSLGCTKSECVQLVEYVFSRPVGDPPQEAGGVAVTFAALCTASKLDVVLCGDEELRRIWTKTAEIREKQKNKPKHSPLPQ